MTYPPEHHLLRDLGFDGEHGPDRARNRIEITDGLHGSQGVRLGVLATMVDVTGASIALRSVRPDWIATADLGVHVLRPISAGSLHVECSPLRVGIGSVVVHATIEDDDGALCGVGRMAFARIPGSATKAVIEDVPGTTRAGLDGGTPVTEPIADLCGFDVVGPGQLRLEKTPYIQNSFGTVNGGVMALATETAAVSAAGGGHATDLNIHYLEQVGDGPIAVTAEVLRADAAAFVSVRVQDRSDGRLVAVCDVTVEPD
ncbi:MAG: PaaI family thioesterase [Acidimicrobiales bacterium]|nr:PaaI family thioesterase [Acidimicrobiales bacterium]